MNRWLYFFVVLIFGAGLLVTTFVYAQTTTPVKKLTPNVESSATPEASKVPILRKAETTGAGTQIAPDAGVSSAVVSLGPNLIQNHSLETTDTSGNPQGWFKGGYGNNTRSFSYPVSGSGGTAKAVQLSVSNYVAGDAKWYFTDVPVTAGHTYVFSNYYKSTIASTLTVRYKKSDGTYSYPNMATLAPASSYTQTSVELTVPAGVVAVTVFHLIQGNGTLTTDEYSLREVQESNTSNLIQNPGFETVGTNGLPTGWSKGGWGTNNRTFSYPVTGVDGGKAAQVSISSYTNGDAKWYTPLIPVSRGVYRYSDAYKSNVTTYLVAEYHNADNTSKYVDIATVPPASTFTSLQASLYVPVDVTSVRIFHTLKSAGTLTIDDTSLVSNGAPTGVFQTGGVTLTFDDGWLSQYNNAVPKLKQAGLKATFFIISHQLADDGFPAFMSRAQVKELYDSGFEIGGHTRTHRPLTSLSNAEQQDEIGGGRQDLIAMGVTPVNAFAYPFGDYNENTITITQNAGFTSARSTLDGFTNPATDHYQLRRESIENTTTLSQVQSWVNSAMTNKTWLILAIHQVDTNSDRYTVPPALFNQIVDYLKTNNIPVITINQGIAAMQ